MRREGSGETVGLNSWGVKGGLAAISTGSNTTRIFEREEGANISKKAIPWIEELD